MLLGTIIKVLMYRLSEHVEKSLKIQKYGHIAVAILPSSLTSKSHSVYGFAKKTFILEIRV